MNLDKRTWRKYRIGEFFNIHPTRAYKNLSKDDLNDGGSTPFVVNSAENNGVGGYSTLEATEKAGIITFSDTTEGNTFFYQPFDFIGFAHVQGMYPVNRDWTRNELLFLITMLTYANNWRYNYGRKMTRENISNSTVILPTKNGTPDWNYMNESIKSLRNKPISTSNKLKTHSDSLKVAAWKNFLISDLFEVRKGKRLTSEDQTDGNTPYIGAIDSNNGVANKIGQEPIHSGNVISLSYNGSVGEAFYQPNPFWATDDVNVLYFREENGIIFNKYIALFICTILKQEKYRYSYGRKWVLKNMESTVIKLPHKDGKPDWEYMENYIKSLPYGDRI